MNSQRFISSGIARCVLIVLMTAAGSAVFAADAPVVFPAGRNIVAGDYGGFTVGGLNDNTNELPAIVYITSEYPERVTVVSPFTQQLTPDGSNYETSISFPASAIKRVDGEVVPVPLDITLTRGGQVFGSLTSDVTVDDPTFTFSPAFPAIRVGDTLPLVIRRVPMNANVPLDFVLQSANGSVLSLGPDRFGAKTNSIAVTFDQYEWNKTVYMSGLTLLQGVDSTNIPVSAHVGSYGVTSIVLVTRNSGLIVSPANPTTAAGDALPMTITRTSTINVSPIQVHLTADDPLTLLVPDYVTIPAGQQSANFSAIGRAPGGATIHATAVGVDDNTNSYSYVTVNNPTLVYSQNPVTNSVGGARVITINRPFNLAGGDLEISFVSLAPSYFRVASSSVIIPAGYLSATTTVYGLSTGTGFLQASVGSFRTNCTVIVNDPSLIFSPGSVSNVVGDLRTVTVTRPAEQNAVDLTLSLSSLSPDIFSLSANTVIIPAGQQSATFQVTGLSAGSGTLVAYVGAYSTNISVTVGAPSVSFLPSSVTNTVGDVRIVTLSRPLGEANAALNLSLASLAPDVFSLGASTVLIPAGSISATVTVYGLTTGAGFLQARSGSYATNLPVTVNSPTITFSPVSLTNSVGDAKTVTVSRPAGEAGAELALSLSSLSPDVFSLDASNVTIAAGNVSATFTVFGLNSGSGFLEARVGSYTTNLAVQVNDPTLTFSPDPMTNTVGDTRTVTIRRPFSESRNSLTITLSSLAPDLFSLNPSSVVIPVGAVSADVTVSGLASGSGTLQARVGAYTTNLSVVVNDPVLTFSPDPLTNTVGDTRTVTIRRPFSQSGNSLTIALSSLAPGQFSLSAGSIVIPVGSVSADVIVTGLASGSGSLQARVGAYTTNLAVAVNSPTLTFSPGTLTNTIGNAKTLTVIRPVAQSGANLVVALSSLDPTLFGSTPASITIAAGSISADVTVFGVTKGTGTLQATVGSYATNCTVIVTDPTLIFSPSPVSPVVGDTRTVTVTRPADEVATEFTLTLSSLAPDVFSLEVNTVTIPANEQSATFEVTGLSVGSGTLLAYVGSYSSNISVTVANPLLTFSPASPAVRVGDTVPLTINRVPVNAGGPLVFELISANGSVLGLGADQVGSKTNVLSVSFAKDEWMKTVYISGLSMIQGVDSTNIPVTAYVGSYAATSIVLVTRNSGLILSPANPSTTAGDALPMTVTRTSTTNVSPIEVQLTADNPLILLVPSVVTIPAGQQSANFSVIGRAPGAATIHATGIGVEDDTNSYALVTVNSPDLVYSQNPVTNSVGGARRVTINRPYNEAGGDLEISFVSLSPSYFRVEPGSATIPAGYISVTTTVYGLTTGTGVLRAAVGSYTTNCTVIVNDPSFVFSPSAVSSVVGDRTIVTVTRASDENAVDLTLTLSSLSPDIFSLSANTVIMPAGQQSATFEVTGLAAGDGTLVASVGSFSANISVTVVDPVLTFNPASPAVRVGDTVPLTVNRVSLNSGAPLDVLLISGNGAVLGLVTATGDRTNAVSVSFNEGEWTKTVYISGLSMIQGVDSTNIPLTAYVGNYAATSIVLVTRNSGLILSPANPTTAAGDALPMTVTRTSMTNVSPIEVQLTADNPLILLVPDAVTIPARQQSANFSVVGRAPGGATIHATGIGVEDNTNSYAFVTVNNPDLVYSQNPVTNSVGGARRVTINRPYNEAGGDLEISFVSLAPSYFGVASSHVIIPAGYISVTTTVFGLSTGTGFLQAGVGSFRTNCTVIVNDPSLIFSPSAISNVVGDLRTVTVTRPSDENAVDLTLTLSSLSPDVFSVSANTVIIHAGEQSATFQVTGLSAGNGTLVAYVGAYSTNISVTVGAPSVSFLPSSVTNIVGDMRIVTLSRPLGEASAALNLSLASLAPDVFSLGADSVLIPAGSISATVTVYGLTTGAGFLQARSGSYATNLPITVNSPTITFAPGFLTNSVGDAKTVIVSRPAGEAGADLSLALSSLSPDVFSLSAGSVTIRAGLISATVTVFGVTSGSGFMEARVGSYATNLAVQVNPPVLTFSPVPLTNTVGDARNVTITRPLTQAGSSLSVLLASLSPGVFSVGASSVTIPTGFASATVTVFGVAGGSGFLEARVGTYTTNLSVLVNDPTLSFLPTPLSNTVGDAKTLTIIRPVGESGNSLSISLSSLAPDLFRVDPASVVIPAGEISVNVTVFGLATGSGIVQANAGSYSTNLIVTVGDPTLTFTPSPLTNRVNEIRTVTIRRPVSQSGASLAIRLSTLSVDVLAIDTTTLTIGANEISGDFLVLGVSSGSGSINASVGSYSTNLQVTVPPTSLGLSGPVAVRVNESGSMTVTRGGDSPSSSLDVTLAGSDSGQFLTVPSSVTIQGGQTSANFSVTGRATTTGVEVRASAAGYPSASVLMPVIPTNPLLQYIVWRDVDASKTYNAGDTVTLTFNSSMATSTVTTANLTLKELNASYAWINSPTGSWGAGSTVTVVDPGTFTKFMITLAGAPVLGAGIAVDPSAAVTDVLGFPDTTFPPVYLPGAEADTNTNGIPDWWEDLHFGCAACVDANADPDHDGLINLWEFKLGADPLDAFSLDPSKLVNDGDWDSDGDTLINRLEINEYGTDPLAVDTDDDGWTDGQELNTSILKNDWWRGRRMTSPINSRSPLVQRSMRMTGVPVAIPDEAYLNRAEWMVDLWVQLTNTTSTGNLVCRKTNTGLTNFCLRVDNNVPTIEFQSPGGTRYAISGAAVPASVWTHLTASWIPNMKSLELKQNDQTYQAQLLASACAQGRGSAIIADTGLGGYLDKVVIRNPLPIDVVFVLDISGSMSGEPLVALKKAANLAIDTLPQDTPIGIVAFSDDATNLTQGFSTDKVKLRRIINSLVTKNATDYILALECATNLVATSSTLDRHLEIFISDGQPNTPPGAASPPDELLIKSANMGIVIDTIGFRLDDPTELQRLSDLTDGKYVDAPTAEDLQAAFSDILAGLFKTRYLFDDGGLTAEDYERPLNWDNALSGVTFETNTYVETTDLELGDTDPPQWWQTLFFGVNGCDPLGDNDKDGLVNLYEYYCDTNPRDDDTDHNGVLDGAEDYDGDGLQNQDEQMHASDPRLTDTDDDGISDLQEKLAGTDPAYSLSPYFPRVLRFGGTTNDFLTMPLDSRFKLMSWTVEAWVNPAAGWGGNGSVIHRDSEAGETNFFLGLNGSLQPVAGFGRHSVTGAAAVTNDSVTWTHLAATYNSAAQELTLFVNATQVAVKVCSENPRASGIGPVVQRIGESFNGLMDEVRIWNVSRSPESIASERFRSLSGNDPGLVAYYRFDDNTRWVGTPPVIGTSGNNITNGASAVDPGIHPWTWGQVEDFAAAFSKKDWTNRWRNAATINGNVTYSNAPGVTVQYPAVRVILQPVAAGSGAGWSLNGSDWFDSGDVAALSDTNNLIANIGYRSVPGWTEPPPETIQLTNGVTRTLVRNYQMDGSLSVFLEPEGARSNGALWRVDGGTWWPSEMVVSNVSPGAHQLDFTTIDGWQEPPLETVFLSEGQALVLTKFFSAARGSLIVNIEPAGARAAGAQWSADGGGWQNSGVANSLTPGNHSVSFRDLAEWTTPASQQVAVIKSQTNVMNVTYQFGVRSVSGMIFNESQWDNRPPRSNPPGDGSGIGRIRVGAWLTSTEAYGLPLYQSLLATNVLPAFGSNYAYSINYLEPQPTYLGYQVRAWVDADNNGRYDIGEPASIVSTFTFVGDNIGGINVTIEDDLDSDSLPDWWEAHWFGNTGQTGSGDFDHDGLSNLEEYNLANGASGLASLNPANFDTDGDGMDDKWEVDHYNGGAGLNPTNDDAFADADGDGLSNIQEYNGVDGLPRIEQDMGKAWGIASTNATSNDAMNPLDIDTDGDGLVDSFEATWYDVTNGIDPINAVAPTGMLQVVIVKADGTAVTNTTTLAGADPDQDGLTHYREQCLLKEFREGGSNDIWSTGISALPVMNANGIRAFNPPLLLGATNSSTIAGDLAVLRAKEWTNPGNPDTDGDLLPDGWEVEYNLDPKSAAGDDGFWGDPDGDGLLNIQEYLGQDGNRSPARAYVNGTGDETSPKEHNWRPDSTGQGPGIMRPTIAADYWYHNEASPTNGTLGAALPTASLGMDDGLDTDDDGIPDAVEIQMEYLHLGIDPSPVHSMSPFIKRAALIGNDSGIVIPDPEGSASNYSPLLHKRDWTVECQVKLLATNMTGYLVDNPGPLGIGDISYRLSLTNNTPVIAFNTLGGMYYKVVGPVLPTGKWIHVAGSWDHGNNSLALYVDGVFVQDTRITEEALSSRLYGSATPPVIGRSADGTFSNRLMMDEIRIWGVARSADQIETYRTKLVPQNSTGLLAYYRFDDGGKTAEDFARKAKNGLFGSASDDYLYGDFGYALPTNHFSFVTNDYAMVLGVDARGADDTDGDGMPDDWEMVNHLDPLSTNGINGAWADADGDGLVNIYEFWADTNPHDWDTDQNGVLDVNEDRDGDGVVNVTEQQLGSRPDIVDTDDDGLTDNEERGAGSNPADATDPAVSRAVEFDGAASDYLEVPISIRQRMVDWTIEAWVNPASLAGGQGTIVRRVVQNLGGGSNAMNFVLGVETNAAGALQMFTGYVLSDGLQCMIHGGEVPTGAWTHVAAIYNSANASLTLYTNGYFAASSNGLYSAPPINGKGGETFVRIGEDFQGRIDELRVWNIARTVTQIRTNYTRTVSEDQTNLVHYFRFDDGQATTNVVPFNQFHQPHGAQDFTYPRDWMEEWKHAASFHGNARFVEPGGVVPPPSLRLNLQPAAAISDGAQWSLDGGSFNNSGMTLNNLSAGSHTILYKSIYDWTAPSNEVVVLTNGVATTLTRTYLLNGRVTVSLEPLGAVSAGAQWRLDGGDWQNSGGTVSNLSPEAHSLEFKPVSGWAEPISEVLTIGEGDHISITRTYGESLSVLQVNLLPVGATAGGAQWNVNGGAWRDSGTNVSLSSGEITVGYRAIPAWIGPSNETVNLIANTTTTLTRVYVQNTTTDTDNDGLLDAWEVMWFGDLKQTADGDPDHDGLSNLEEFRASVIYTNLATLSPRNFDSDGDGMDDKWEYDRYLRGAGLNPCSNDAMQDYDGDGLLNIQEYNGMDGLPRLQQDVAEAAGIASTNLVSGDALNPLSIDTDGDGLVDSFEAAWYNPSFGIDPTNGAAPASITHITVVVPGGTNYTVDTTLAGSDPDVDGLTDYREQCLLSEFSQGGANDIWTHGTNSLPQADNDGVRKFSPPLLLGATNSTTIAGDIDALRGHAWTDPAYFDTDHDLLPDGWEVEFNLDPRSAIGDDGFYGDPDHDGLLNTEEYLGQDGLRATNAPYINGTGDETNPKEHNWRPDSTDVGPGTMRPAITNDYWYHNAASPTNGTLGAARPTTSLGVDDGLDTDDDGIPDNVEIQQEYAALGVDPSPVHSMSPFIKRSMMITRAAGVGIPDPEGAAFNWRALLHRSDFTIECYVKLLGTNLTGFLVDNPGPLGGDITYRLGLTNNVPYVSFNTIGMYYYKVLGSALPTNRWIHLAGAWDADNNSLSLYVDGIFVEEQRIVEPAMSSYLYASATQPTIGFSADGSFSNRLMMDEIRIWGVARTAGQIEQYRTQLVPQNSSGLLAYYRFDDGGATAEDFARKAQNGLFTAVSRDYTFGDFGYALRTNGFRFVTNDYAMVLGVDARGADDTDGDGMPDDWETVNHLDPLSTNGVDGALGDPDGDGLVNIYEYWSDTNPHAWDTDQDGQLDVNEDRDGDGVANLVEQQLGSRPDIVDTDDDGLDDNQERIAGSNPADANDPPVSRALSFGGTSADYMEIPTSIRQRMSDWTIESWMNPNSVTGGVGTIVRRVVQNIGGGTNAMNYVLGVETNASGGLQVYGGYVLTDGRQFLVRGGSVPTGLWTYAAISYDSLTSALLLYTNGALAVSSNAQFSTPPINGKGGETFVRVGENFQGRIDEVRMWNVVRSDADLFANFSNTVSELQTNLVHYFRFDDGQAVTNRLPFGPFHQPHNAQDYTYSRDWMNEWKHAGLFHGNVSFFGPGAIQPPASLRVNLLPVSAVIAGAQWALNGGAYNNSGDTVGNLPSGTNIVLYKSISGWTAPANETVVLTNGVATTITRTYLQNGSLKVNIEPAAVGTGGQWRVDLTGAWQDNGATVTNLSPFVHTVEFKPVAGWLEPAATNITIVGAATQTMTVTYQDSRGFLEVFLSPAAAVLAGARWNLDGGAWLNTGTNLVTVPSGLHDLNYQVIPGWVAPSNETINIIAFTTTIVFRAYGGTDTDQDGLLDAWEVRWFGDLRYNGDDDPDHDGLNNRVEFNASQIYPVALDTLSPANFDSDGDGMDDKWEYDRYLGGAGLNPCSNDAMLDRDGDGLVNIQEYNGMDGLPRLMQDPQAAAGVASTNVVSTDDLNPLNYDTDGDHLVDSFEAAWYNAGMGVDPLSTGMLFSADTDADGMSSYREQCLLLEFREGEVNDIWSHGTNDLPGPDANGIYAFNPPLLLGATNATTIIGDLAALRGHEWTDPANADTDDDGLPDGWEVEFNLDPKSSVGVNGFYGDPDGDGLLNAQEFLGQDGNRSTNLPNVNGTGDETSPNQHNWRPVSTGPGPGTMRPVVAADYWYLHDASPTNGTLGAALPTASLGFDRGTDTDDDGIPDSVEIQSEYRGLGQGSSPVHSMSPFIKRSAMIKRASGIEIPDPEGSPFNYSPLLHQRDWTVECYVKLLGTNLTGYLVNNPGPLGVGDVSYRLSLSNNAPIVSFHTLGGFYYKVCGPTLPTNRWIHLAGVWNHADNYLALYIDGVYFQSQRITEEAISSREYASVTPPVIGASADGSFTNRLLMDEIRIWGVARTTAQLEQYRRALVPQNSFGLQAYYRFDDGGTTAEDFAHKAKNGLLGADSTDYFFGDFGYALRTNGFAFVTNDYAMVLGVDVRGADDTDGDGMPDDWETVNHLNPLSAEGDDGAMGDPDHDGLVNIYEYWSDTNPHSPDTDQDGTLDINEDRDGDGLANLLEQRLGSRPDMIDTDDDGLSDDVEQANRTSPADATDPQIGRAMAFGGGANDYLEIPTLFSQRLTDWSLEAWVYPSNAVDGAGTIIRRTVQKISPLAFAVNYEIGLENDGAGGLRLYAGYVTVDGSNYVIRTLTNSIPTGTWTHVAATYNWNASALILYTNGAVAYRDDPLSAANPPVPAMVTNFFIPPPLNGKGGECFVRIGEDFAGWIDEVRLWNDTRGPDEIRLNLYTYFNSDAQGLIHNFNFDDSEANTNTYPFGQFHQPFGAQDIVYPKDWTNQWIHAAFLRGNVNFTTNTAVTPPPSIRVILQPQGAVDAGAQWSVDGGIWRNSGETAQGLDRINPVHTIFYKSVDGWSAPQTEAVSVSNGMTTVLTRSYIRRGSLTVFVQPPEAIDSAKLLDNDDHLWSIGNYGEGAVKGGLTYHRSGDTITNLDVSTYTLRFWPVSGWNPPASVIVDITEGAHVIQVGQYRKVVASLSVVILPQEANTAGARWRVDSGPWALDGAITNLDYGPHTVEFLPVAPWVTPLSQTVTVSNDAVFTVTGRYTEVTGVYVELQPIEAVTNGAGWRLVGETNYLASDTLRTLSAGSYTMEFRPLAGWLSPGLLAVVVVTNNTTFITASYLQSDVLFTNLLNFLNKPRGLALDSRRRLYIADSGNNRIIVYDTQSGSVTNWGGPASGAGLGQFYEPQAIAVDPSNNVFVADTHNNRVQRRNSASGAWTQLPAINAPWDITLDWRTNVYVADYYNDRVQKLVQGSGSWTTFVGTGFADGLVMAPGGVTVDPYNNIVISDFPNNLGRVQRFSTNGVLINRMGSHLASEGGLAKPQSLQYAGCNGALFVADVGTNSLVTLARRNSDATWQAVIGGGVVPNVGGLAWDPAAGYLYVSDTDSNRVLRISMSALADIPPTISVSPATNGTVITWGGVAGWFYTVQYSDSLMNPWTNLTGSVDIQAAYSFRFMSAIDTNNLGIPSRIYRMLYH